jgi:hypothetical protein
VGYSQYFDCQLKLIRPAVMQVGVPAITPEPIAYHPQAGSMYFAGKTYRVHFQSQRPLPMHRVPAKIQKPVKISKYRLRGFRWNFVKHNFRSRQTDRWKKNIKVHLFGR